MFNIHVTNPSWLKVLYDSLGCADSATRSGAGRNEGSWRVRECVRRKGMIVVLARVGLIRGVVVDLAACVWRLSCDAFGYYSVEVCCESNSVNMFCDEGCRGCVDCNARV